MDLRANSRAAALALALAIFVLDQASKLFVLHALNLEAGRVPLLPFLDLTLVWNRGISYGLFQQSGAGRWALVGLTFAASIGLAVWLWRAERRLLRIALALLVGGAVGNLVDRVVYGAVVDFIHVYVGTFSWYVFNVADAAIVIGVVLLLFESLVRPSPRRPAS